MSEVECIRCGRRGEAIEGVPYGGKIGEEIKAKVCDNCWKEWYAHSIKLINEYRISLRNAEGREFLASQMKIFFKMMPASEGQMMQNIPESSDEKS